MIAQHNLYIRIWTGIMRKFHEIISSIGGYSSTNAKQYIANHETAQFKILCVKQFMLRKFSFL